MTEVGTLPNEIYRTLLDYLPLRLIGLVNCTNRDLNIISSTYLRTPNNELRLSQEVLKTESIENIDIDGLLKELDGYKPPPIDTSLEMYILYRLSLDLDKEKPKRFFKIARADKRMIIYSNSYWSYYREHLFDYLDYDRIVITEKTPIIDFDTIPIPHVVYEILAKLNLLKPFTSSTSVIRGFWDEEQDLLIEGNDITKVIQYIELMEPHRDYIVRVYKKIDLDYILSELAIYTTDEDGYYDEESFLDDPLEYLQIESTDTLSIEYWLLIYAISQTTVVPILEI